MRLSNGKNHPCDPGLLTEAECVAGDKLVTDDRDIVVVGKGPGNAMGYISHFSTCPDADDWRGKKTMKARRDNE